MAEELKACPFCSCTDIGEVTINPRLEQRHRRFKVYCKACQCRTSEHKTRKEARIYWNTRTQLPSQGGEAVAWLNVATGCVTTLPVVVMDWDDEGEEVQSLYTHPADQVADDLTMVKVSRELLEDLRDCANECYNHARMRGTSGLEHYENLTEQADAKLAILEVKP